MRILFVAIGISPKKIIAVFIDLHMIEDDIRKVKETMKGYNTLYLMDQKIIRPQMEGVPINFEKYRTKMVKTDQDTAILTVNYDTSPGPSAEPARGFAKLAQSLAGLLNFKIGDIGGNFYYSVTDGNLLSNTHIFKIMNGREENEIYSAKHRMMALAKESLEVMDLNGTILLKTEYRGYRKLIEVMDQDGNLAANLYAPIISLRDRWKLEFVGDTDRLLGLIMAAIISEMGNR